MAPLPMENNPPVAFERMFGRAGSSVADKFRVNIERLGNSNGVVSI